MNLAKEIAVGNNAVDTTTKVARDGKESATAQILSLQRKLVSAQTHIGENYECIVVMDLNGVVFADSLDGKLKGLEAGDREYFKLAKQGKYNTGDVAKSNPTSAVGTVKLLIFQNLRSKVVTTNCVFQIFAADSVLASARGYAGEYPVSLRVAI
jgi:hypothetical protein